MRTIYYNGVVYTGTLPLAEAFAVEADKFIFAGSKEQAKAFAEENSKYVDLEGKFVCCGFNDSHMHLLEYGNALYAARLEEHTSSLSGLLEYLKDFKKEHPAADGRWLMGRGFNQDYFADVKRMPDRFDLDQVSEEVPICIIRACGHCLVVNSKALALLGIGEDVVQPEGGKIDMVNGIPSGRFYENAMELVYAAIPVPDRETLKDMIRVSCKALNACGITSSQTDDYGVFQNISWQEVNAAYRELEAAGELTVRVYEQSNFTSPEKLRAFVEAGNITGTGSEMFKIGPLKMVADGALGAGTAYLSQPYADDPAARGMMLYSKETLEAMIGYAHAQGMQIAVHAIGDGCLDLVLSAYEKALRAHPRKDHRHGIVHCQITRPDQLKKMEALKLHIYAQSIFLDYDIRIVEKRVGKKLAATSYHWKYLLDHGLSVSNGSDCPVETPFVMKGIQCAVTRSTLKEHMGPYLPDQAYTVQEALDSYTVRGAEGSFEEKIKGRIAAGMLADFVILDQNPFETERFALQDISVNATYLGGRKVYDAAYPYLQRTRQSHDGL